MELTYHRKGDYLFPNLTVQDEPMSIGKYGMLRRTYLKENRKNWYQSMLMLFAAIVAALAVILTGIIALHMPVVPVCLIVLLETGIACCLHDVPIWLHAIAVIVQIIAGVLTGATVFMVLCVVEYLVGILCLRYVRD